MSSRTPEEKILYPNRLTEIRTTRVHKTVADMAVMIGVSPASIYRWEAGTHYCKLRAIRHRMFKAYQTKPKDAYPSLWKQLFQDTGEDLMEGM